MSPPPKIPQIEWTDADRLRALALSAFVHQIRGITAPPVKITPGRPNLLGVGSPQTPNQFGRPMA